MGLEIRIKIQAQDTLFECRDIGINLKGAKSWKLQSKCPVDGERAQVSVIEQEAKAVWLLAVELPEVATAFLPWRRGSTLHKWCARNKGKEWHAQKGNKEVKNNVTKHAIFASLGRPSHKKNQIQQLKGASMSQRKC
ncbi:hypothetical protein E2542_SST30976 [Spatholobus suberectus]|nr:hypothetical protein E2542_SST30976 [Spatholobus suberectus]